MHMVTNYSSYVHGTNERIPDPVGILALHVQYVRTRCRAQYLMRLHLLRQQLEARLLMLHSTPVASFCCSAATSCSRAACFDSTGYEQHLSLSWLLWASSVFGSMVQAWAKASS